MLRLIAIVGFSGLMLGSSSYANACEILFAENSSNSRQKRARLFVLSSADNSNDRAAVAKMAAITAVQYTGFDYIDVFLIPRNAPKIRAELSSISSTAWAKYAPNPAVIPFMDENWIIETTDKPPVAPNWYSHEIKLNTEAVEQIDSTSVVCDFANLNEKLN